MYAAISPIVVIAPSVLAVRSGTIALELASISSDYASLRSISALPGAGYTTREAGAVVASPVRRTIARTLVRPGNVGTIAAIAAPGESTTETTRNNPPRP